MSFKGVAAVAVIYLLLGSGVASGEPDMQEGMWEMTIKTEMPGMPMEMQPMKFNQCLTRKNLVPQNREKSEDCRIISTKVDGNTVTWAAQCRMKDGIADSTGKITYLGKSFSGVVKVVMNMKDTGKMEVTQHMSGRRIGDCK